MGLAATILGAPRNFSLQTLPTDMKETGSEPADDESSRSTNKPDRPGSPASADPSAGESDSDPREENSPQKARRDKEFPSRTGEDRNYNSSGSQRRVSVTPNDWKKLEALSEEIGLPYSKV